MFFYLSKLLTFLISPTVIIVLLLFASLLARKVQTKRRLLVTSLVLLLIFSNPFIIGRLMRAWELKDTAFTQNGQYDIAIVLSGFMTRDPELHRLTFGDDVDRLTEALSMYRKGQVDRILISGGSGSMVIDTREALLAREFLVKQCHVPDSVILIDTVSRNTYENAVETKKILEQNKISSPVLITSAFHMRRAKGCFDKAGIPADIYSTDPEPVKQGYYPEDLFIPDTRNIRNWERLMREIVGVLMYELKGYS
ncbi:MAG: YdcF family protein [Daejeonella sp.]